MDTAQHAAFRGANPGVAVTEVDLLAQLQRRLPHDWERRYALRPVLLETFCESARFLGTCYQSANWLCVGYTQGRGKLDVHRQSALPVKSVWLKPLALGSLPRARQHGEAVNGVS